MRRKKMKKSYSKKNFTKHAVKVKRQNSWNPMRGGIRL